MNGPQAHWLADGRRLHLHHGPIDLIVEAFGAPEECRAACAQAVARFETILTELVAELPELRMPACLVAPTHGGTHQAGCPAFAGPTARRMEAAVLPLAKDFITPMAAVAGSVADEVLAAMLPGRRLERAYVNNGGDSALHLAEGQSMALAIAGTGTGHGLADRITIRSADPVRGLATSGWRGRSFSLGIADAVTVLAGSGAAADAAATIVANAVDLPGHTAVQRRPASDLAPDSDLGARLVTTGVGVLSPDEVDRALDRGLAVAEDLRMRGLIVAAALFLNGQSRICSDLTLPLAGRVAEQSALEARTAQRGGGVKVSPHSGPPPRLAASVPLRLLADPPHKEEGRAPTRKMPGSAEEGVLDHQPLRSSKNNLERPYA